MLIYILLFAISIVFAFVKPKRTQYIIPTFLCLIISLRASSVGTDVVNYSKTFLRMNENPNSWNYPTPMDIGFNYFLIYFKKYISNNPMNSWGTVGIIYVIGCFSFFKRYAKSVNICLFLFIGIGSYLLGYNIMRQCFGLGLFLWITAHFNLLEKEKWIKLIILTILSGYLFHSTLYILLILPIYNQFLYKIRINLYYAFAVIISTLLLSKLNLVMGGIESLVEKTMAEGKLINYALRNAQNEEGAGYSFFKLLLNSIFCCYTIYTLKEVKNLYAFILLFATCFINLFGNIVVEFARVYELLMVIGLICISDLFGSNINSLKGNLYRFATILYASLLYANILLKNYGEIVPYITRF